MNSFQTSTLFLVWILVMHFSELQAYDLGKYIKHKHLVEEYGENTGFINDADQPSGQTKTIFIGLILGPDSQNVSQDYPRSDAPISETLVRQRLDRINLQISSSKSHGALQFQLVTTNLVSNPIEMGIIVCQKLIGHKGGGVSAVFVETHEKYQASIASISYTLGMYHIPIIGTTLRDSSLFNKDLHPSYISLIPPNSHQADLWYNLMLELRFKRAFILTTPDSRNLLSRFVDLNGGDRFVRQNNERIEIEAIIEHTSSDVTDPKQAEQGVINRLGDLLDNSICRVMLIHAQSRRDAEFFIDLIEHFNMTSREFVLILSEETVRVAQMNNVSLPRGVLTSRLRSSAHKGVTNSVAYALDALDILVRSISDLISLRSNYPGDQIGSTKSAFDDVPKSCSQNPSTEWLMGIDLYLTILNQTFYGQTGLISFDENGDRLTASYDILNVPYFSAISKSDASNSVHNHAQFDDLGQSYETHELVKVGSFENGFYGTNHGIVSSSIEETNKQTISRDLDDQSTSGPWYRKTLLDIEAIQWPGGLVGGSISGIYINKHLRIVTLREKPFLWVLDKQTCSQHNYQGRKGEHNDKDSMGLGDSYVTRRMGVPCTSWNSVMGLTETHCCVGYCVDLLIQLSTSINFTFDLYLVSDNQYGNLELPQDQTKVVPQLRSVGANSGAIHNRDQHLQGHHHQNQQQQQSLSETISISEEVHHERDKDFDLERLNNQNPRQRDLSQQIPSEMSSSARQHRKSTSDLSQAANILGNSDQIATPELEKKSDQADLETISMDLVTTTDGQQQLSQPQSGSSEPRWNGLMGELVSRRADMAVAPLTITPQRAQAVDFSKPFKHHGFSILLRRASRHPQLASFLQPFQDQLWVLVIGVATHVVALSLYLLDRYSTFGRLGMRRNIVMAPERHAHDDHPLHLSSSLWFSWSILLNSGVGEHTPKSLSGRVLGIFWSGFAMIVVASYTANLAAFLVLDSREDSTGPSLSGIDDPRLRSGDLAFNLATVKNSAVEAYLQSQVEYINLYRKMEEFNFESVDEAIGALRAGHIDGLIWDSTRLEWEVASDERCGLGIAGEQFGTGGYAIGLQHNSFWTKNVTTKLLQLHESGFMMELDKRWITSSSAANHHLAASGGVGGQNNYQFAASGAQQAGSGPTGSGSSSSTSFDRSDTTAYCERRQDEHPETLGIVNIAGIFILFACGIATSCGLIWIERVAYSRRHQLKGLWARLFSCQRRVAPSRVATG